MIIKGIWGFNNLQDIDTIMEKIFDESRHLTNSDAGLMFIAEDNRLLFGYVHNDSPFKKNEANEEIYVDFLVPINPWSIVDYAATIGDTIVIKEAYNLPTISPFTFNSVYDRKFGYKTQSNLAISLHTFHDRLLGIMQLINAKEETGWMVPFSKKNE